MIRRIIDGIYEQLIRFTERFRWLQGALAAFRQGTTGVRRWWVRNASFVIVTLGLIVLILGFFGFRQQQQELRQAAAANAALPGPEMETAGEGGRDPAATDSPSAWLAWGRSVYDTVRIFVLETGSEKPDNRYLFVARFAALFLFVYAAYRVIYALLADSLDRVRLRWLIRPHAVVCGVGEIGMQLIEDLRRPGPRQMPVVVVEADEDSRYLRQCRQWGAIVKIGDARDRETLEQIQLHRARKLFICTGSDDSNIEVTMEACGLLRGRQTTALHCFVHLGKADLVDTLKTYAQSVGVPQEVELHVFNVFSNSARQLIRKHLPADRPGPEQVGHYVIFGFGALGSRIALELARVAHFENRLRPRMTIIDEAFADKQRRFRARYPKFSPQLNGERFDWDQTHFDQWGDRTYRPGKQYRADSEEAHDRGAIEYVCNAEFLELPEGVESEDLESILMQIGTPRSHVRFFVAGDDDSRNFDAAMRLRARLQKLEQPELEHARIYAGLPRQAGLAQLLTTRAADGSRTPVMDPASAIYNIVPFGECHETCNLDEVERPGMETLARALHEDYREQAGGGMESWEDLSEDYRMSNRHAADHMEIKLAILGGFAIGERAGDERASRREGGDSPSLVLLKNGKPASGEEEAEFQDQVAQKVGVLAQTEHYRYVAERLLQGWGYGKRGTRKATKILRESICPWEQLPVDERKKDYAQMSVIGRLLDLDISQEIDAAIANECNASAPLAE